MNSPAPQAALCPVCAGRGVAGFTFYGIIRIARLCGLCAGTGDNSDYYVDGDDGQLYYKW